MSSIGGISTDVSTITGNSRMADLTSEEFVQIIVTELQNQDPFNPSDTNAMLEQISSIRDIESQLDLQQRLEALVEQNEVSSASGLIGQFVSGLSESLQQTEGIVESIRIEDGKPVLMVNTGAGVVRMQNDSVIEVFNLGDVNAATTQSLLSSLVLLDSASLIGKFVRGTDASGDTRSGIVSSVTVEDGVVMLELDDGHKINAGSVTRMSETAISDDEADEASE